MWLNVCYVTFWAQALRPYVSIESLTVGAHGVRPLFDNMNLSPQVRESRDWRLKKLLILYFWAYTKFGSDRE
jgi:hypothetical protein